MERAIFRTCAHFNQNACDGRPALFSTTAPSRQARGNLSDSSRNDLLWSQQGPRHEGRCSLSTGTTTAHIVETGESAFAVSIDVSGHHLIGDEPVEQDGGDLGPAPYDLLLAALGECTAMTVRWYARQQN